MALLDQSTPDSVKLEEEKWREKITIIEFEEKYPKLAKEFQKVQQEQYELFAGKMLDYGLSNISLGSNLEEKQDIHLSLTGIWLRCNDKINRLKNM